LVQTAAPAAQEKLGMPPDGEESEEVVGLARKEFEEKGTIDRKVTANTESNTGVKSTNGDPAVGTTSGETEGTGKEESGVESVATTDNVGDDTPETGTNAETGEEGESCVANFVATNVEFSGDGIQCQGDTLEPKVVGHPAETTEDEKLPLSLDEKLVSREWFVLLWPSASRSELTSALRDSRVVVDFPEFWLCVDFSPIEPFSVLTLVNCSSGLTSFERRLSDGSGTTACMKSLSSLPKKVLLSCCGGLSCKGSSGYIQSRLGTRGVSCEQCTCSRCFNVSLRDVMAQGMSFRVEVDDAWMLLEYEYFLINSKTLFEGSRKRGTFLCGGWAWQGNNNFSPMRQYDDVVVLRTSKLTLETSGPSGNDSCPLPFTGSTQQSGYLLVWNGLRAPGILKVGIRYGKGWEPGGEIQQVPRRHSAHRQAAQTSESATTVHQDDCYVAGPNDIRNIEAPLRLAGWSEIGRLQRPRKEGKSSCAMRVHSGRAWHTMYDTKVDWAGRPSGEHTRCVAASRAPEKWRRSSREGVGVRWSRWVLVVAMDRYGRDRGKYGMVAMGSIVLIVVIVGQAWFLRDLGFRGQVQGNLQVQTDRHQPSTSGFQRCNHVANLLLSWTCRLKGLETIRIRLSNTGSLSSWINGESLISRQPNNQFNQDTGFSIQVCVSKNARKSSGSLYQSAQTLFAEFGFMRAAENTKLLLHRMQGSDMHEAAVWAV
ncbi:MFS general substrate transporter, partial [Aureobasidium melanogenum]